MSRRHLLTLLVVVYGFGFSQAAILSVLREATTSQRVMAFALLVAIWAMLSWIVGSESRALVPPSHLEKDNPHDKKQNPKEDSGNFRSGLEEQKGSSDANTSYDADDTCG